MNITELAAKPATGRPKLSSNKHMSQQLPARCLLQAL